MKNSRNPLHVLLPAIAAISIAACSQSGGPSARAEAEQSASSTSSSSREWTREDLIVRSSASNITIPAPGMVANILAEAVSKFGIVAGSPISIALISIPPIGEKFTQDMIEASFSPGPETFDTENHISSIETFSTLVDHMAKAGPNVGAALESSVGLLVAAPILESILAGDYESFIKAERHTAYTRIAARWCSAPTHNITGWPVNAMSRSERDQDLRRTYINTVEVATQRCAVVVQKIMADIGPIAYADQDALRVAVLLRMAEFSPEELMAIADGVNESTQKSLDLTGVQGHAWTSSLGRFHNQGDGFSWRDGGLVMFDASHLYGREVTIQLASMASGTQRQGLVTSETVSAEAIQRAAAVLQAGSAPAG